MFQVNGKISKTIDVQDRSVQYGDGVFETIAVKEKLKEGKNEKEITDYLVERYGEFILLKPRFKPNTYFLWLAPIIIILSGLFLIKGIFRKN